ncbi:MAG: CAP domain-containing protein [Crocinitomicaceae bacterium]|nr:CAP domain-containing protein [Crocinitomicaceae bacterium]
MKLFVSFLFFCSTLISICVFGQEDPSFEKNKAAIEAKIKGKKYSSVYKTASKLRAEFPENSYYGYAMAFGLFYSQQDNYETKIDLTKATFDLLKNSEKLTEFDKGFSQNLQRQSLKNLNVTLKSGDLEKTIEILDNWFMVFNNSEDFLQNHYLNEVQDSLFERSIEYYFNEEQSKALILLDWMDKTFSSEHMPLKYDPLTIYPEDGYNFKEYKHPKYFLANTAYNNPSLSELEKQVIYLHNLVRMDPKLFNKTYVAKYFNDKPELSNTEHGRSLVKELNEIEPLPLLFPDDNLKKAADFHATDIGEHGATGHVSSDGSTRKDRFKKFGASGSGENCTYGRMTPYDIVIGLLVDINSEQKGHRENILRRSFKRIGVSIKPHKTYKLGTVLDYG